MKYAFIFGKNWKLSLAEVISYLEMEKISWEFLDLTRKALVAEASLVPEKVINDLGGTLKIVEISRIFAWDGIDDEVFNETEKQTYLSVYTPKRTLKNLKKIFENIPRKLILSHTRLIKKELYENCFIFGLKSCYFGATVAVSNPFDYKERDTKRPVTDYLTISPSRARILINLAQSKSNMLDPFCGIGTVAQEAVLRGVKTVFCSDISKKAVDSAKRNIEWTKKKYAKRTTVLFKKADIRNFKFEGIQSIATEPDLGPALKEKPKKGDANKILRLLKKKYDFLFRNAYHKTQKDARLAIIFPCINTRVGKIFMDKHYTGFEIIDLFEKIPDRYREYLRIPKNFILDEKREKGKTRNTIREFAIFRVLKK